MKILYEEGLIPAVDSPSLLPILPLSLVGIQGWFKPQLSPCPEYTPVVLLPLSKHVLRHYSRS